MAVFVAAREMGRLWRNEAWIAVAPVICFAFIESLIGLAQIAMSGRGPVSGTYVNRNHFAGLLEMAFPLAVMAVVAAWRKATTRHAEQVKSAVFAAALMVVAACLLTGIVLSLSRAAFIATVVAVVLMVLFGVLSLANWNWSLRWGVLIALPLLVLTFLPPPELMQRLTETDESNEGRVEIWRNTLHLISDYKWTGTGLGSYERGLYPYRTSAPTQSVDFAHNDYLQILAELGVIGAALTYALALWIFWQPLGIAMRGPSSTNWLLAVGLLSALVTLAIHSLTDFNLYIPANAAAFAWLCGVAMSLRPSEKRRRVLSPHTP